MTDTRDDSFFLSEVAIATPLEEFQRTYEKKIRSFEELGSSDAPGDDNADLILSYEKAYRLGAEKLRRRLDEGARC